MNRVVLVAGMPASGKTSFAHHLAEKTALPMLSKDRIKELLYDNIGFRCPEEKTTLGSTSMELLYYFAESVMRTGQNFILENNFEERSKPQLLYLLQTYSYKSFIVRFGGKADVLYNRYLRRDTAPGRHKGHVFTTRYPDTSTAPLVGRPLSFEDFIAGAQQRGIGGFSLQGEEIYVDTTHFSAVNYTDIVDTVRRFLGGELVV